MCIGIPMQVVDPAGPFHAWCEGRGERRLVDLMLVGGQPPGGWVLVFLDSAREAIDPERAHRIGAALDALDAALRGDPLDHLFADLVDREPQLPPHLRSEKTP
ncbi:HypC/HybG/HupF family hydrogenase formation chaperone [Thioalbus denitrificans]|uniref:Hydrogenase expression/formation protein HypC n=1 Tax=Thioalbus denitrificans TaxID=547122 RepID=A0A369CFM4_9GAMM|nr:HypC/HybG/HupF family hydrogenase formation chaperone [Thioalbus denitrificans]RCX32850.1 hydrogenase expression/formation protein HypC [Thioalbus denitrificans]